MSGHSKWSTIKRQKGVADIKRGQTFTKIANAITIAARAGGSGDLNSNPRLRSALEEAKEVNMPKSNIQRAIDRGLGKLPGQTLEEVVYEGFGPGKVAFYIEGVSDNKLRTNQEIRNIFERVGGTLGGQGSTAYMFDKKGIIKVQSSKFKIKNEEEETLELIDLGAEDIESFDEEEPHSAEVIDHEVQTELASRGKQRKYLVYVESPEINTMGTKITQAGYTVESSEITMKPNITVDIHEKESAGKVLDFTGKLEEHDDIQKVYANFEIPDSLINSNI